MSKTNAEFYMKHLKVLVTKKMMMKFYLCSHNFSKLWNWFSAGTAVGNCVFVLF